jgi:hypothetical protein
MRRFTLRKVRSPSRTPVRLAPTASAAAITANTFRTLNAPASGVSTIPHSSSERKARKLVPLSLNRTSRAFQCRCPAGDLLAASFP